MRQARTMAASLIYVSLCSRSFWGVIVKVYLDSLTLQWSIKDYLINCRTEHFDRSTDLQAIAIAF
jgi:hypothetical protein